MSPENLYDYNAFSNIVQMFDEQCGLTPGIAAIQYHDKSLTYSELSASANRIANFLIYKRIKNNDLVGLCLERSVSLGIGVLGILKAGAAYVPFDPEYPAERISHMLETAQCKILITQRKFEHLFKHTDCQIIIWEDAAAEINLCSDENPEVEINKDDLLYVLFTSGSTGMPKGVAMRHEPLVNLLLWQKNETTLVEAARTLQFAPISFDVSFQEFFTTWTTGGTIYMIEDNMRLNALSLIKFIDNYKIERLFLPFIALQHLSEIAVDNQLYPSSLKDIVTAGEQLQITKHVAALFNALPDCILHNHYGPTETHVCTAYTLEGSPENWDALPSIGKAIANDMVYLLDENLYPVKRGEEGELYLGGVGLAKGYLNRDDLTAERFIADPFSDNANARMYKTGDLAKELPDGNLLYLGRKDGQVKIRGYRIELGEIELTIAAHKGIKQVVVIPREDKPGLKRLVAYYVAEEGTHLNTGELRNIISASLPDYMMPAAFVLMDELPRTPSGKIDRRNLPAPDTARPQLSEAYVAASNDIEKNISGIWSNLLLIDEVGIKDNFFELGGNSLLALQFIAKYYKHSGIEIPVVKLYQYPNIQELTAYLRNDKAELNVVEQATERKVRAGAGRSAENKTVEDGIAVIGMSGRFPGANNTSKLWDNLVNGVESTSFFTAAELDPFIDESIKNDPHYVAARGIIKEADQFDAGFFGMNPKIAEITDPQQRIFLEMAWEALENSGYAGDSFKGLAGVFAGVGNNTYYVNNVLERKDVINKVGSFQAMLGNEKDYVATLTSYLLDLKGPAISIHSACSTSLVAIIHAVKSLRDFDCDMALAGGITITAPVNSGHIYTEGSMYSKDGHTRPFDADSSGTTFSDGGGIVVLKRYKEALQDGDEIYGVIRGVGLNNDGHDKASFTAPSVSGQAGCIAIAQADAGIDAETISYIETHGTATPIGDPIEIEALLTAFRGQTDKKQFCAIGSIKSNFGHLTAAAGVAGLIKTALSLHHKIIPATINFSKPNPNIDFANSPFYVNAELSEWKSEGVPRRAGLSSFGVGGTNAHLIIEEAPGAAKEQSESLVKQLLVLSAKTKEALENNANRLAEHLQNNKNENLANVAYTLQTGRKHFSYKKIVVAADVDEAIRLLQNPEPNKTATRITEKQSPDVVFMFPGQGAQYVNMGQNLYRDEKVFRDAVNACCDILQPLMGEDLRLKLYPASDDAATAELSLKETFYTQPALFTIGYALSKLWMSWGVYPKALIGHSIGEFVAACIAEVMSLEDALKLVASRGRLMQNCPRGSMLSVRQAADLIEKRLPPELSIAAVNGPQLCVVAGNTEAVNKLQAELEKEEIVCKPLHTSHAFHSPMMDEIVEPFHAIVKTVKLNAPQLPILSTVTKQLMTAAEATDPMYWAKHLRATVRFAEGIQALWKENPQAVLLECGPRTTAATLARQQATDLKKQVAISSLGDNANDNAEWSSMLFALGQLWLNGVNPDWNKFYSNEKRIKVVLPTYAFDHKRYWIDPPQMQTKLTLPNHQANVSTIIPPNYSQQVTGISSTIAEPQLSQIPITMNRKEQIITELKELFEEASGMEMNDADSNSTFTEMGLDSLFITQIASGVTKKYHTKVTFRQLNEDFSSFGSLSGYIDSKLPADALQPKIVTQVAPQQQQNATMQQTPPANFAQPMMPSGNSAMQAMLLQQMQMQQQLMSMIMGGQMTHAPMITPSVQVPQPSVSTPAPAVKDDGEEKKPFGAIARIEKKKTDDLTAEQKEWLKKFTLRYTEKTKSSKQFTQDHREHFADPRVVTGFKPGIKELVYQVVIESSKEAYVYDLDGNKYVDILNGFGSNMFGHSPAFIKAALLKQIEEGYELGPQHPLAGKMAELICQMTGADRAALCNTGSEAVLGCMRMARTVTGRSLIVAFHGSYHGINDEVIVHGTKKLKSLPAAAGIPQESVENMLILDYGTDESLQIIKDRIKDIAAVMVEPIQSRRADFRPKAFLQEVRKITEENEVAFIFDEVITGFRLGPGGAQEYFGIKADIASYGKVCGGGMPIGVMAGKKLYMDALDGGQWQFGDDSVPEAGVTYFAGTFVRHPFALAAGVASLEYMINEGPALQQKLADRTEKMVNELNAFCTEKGLTFHWATFGSLFKMKYDHEFQHSEWLSYLLREKGIHAIDGFPCFLTTAHTDEDIRFIIDKHKEAIQELIDLGIIPSNQQKVNGHNILHKESAAQVQDGELSQLKPPVVNARLGKDANGKPAWYIRDPERPGKYIMIDQV
ncbi:MAG: amino acid adenylation domain-containing protein [Bacteroidia bacterium]